MNGLMLFGDCFEDTEAIASLDVLLRAGENVKRVSVMNSLYVKTQCGSEYKCDLKLSEVNIEDFDYLVIPGGKASFTVLSADERVGRLIDYFVLNNKLVAAICAAPHLIGKRGYLKDREFTVFPGFENECVGGIYKRDSGVIRDDKFVTAKTMYYSIEFALEIINYLYGEDKRNKVEKSLMGER